MSNAGVPTTPSDWRQFVEATRPENYDIDSLAEFVFHLVESGVLHIEYRKRTVRISGSTSHVQEQRLVSKWTEVQP